MKYDIIYLFLIFNNCLKPKTQQTIELLMDNGWQGVEVGGWVALGWGETGGSTTMNSKSQHASYVWFMNYAFSNYFIVNVAFAVSVCAWQWWRGCCWCWLLLFLLLLLLLYKLFIYFSKWKHKFSRKNKKCGEKIWKKFGLLFIIKLEKLRIHHHHQQQKLFFLFSGCFCLPLVELALEEQQMPEHIQTNKLHAFPCII